MEQSQNQELSWEDAIGLAYLTSDD